MARYQTESPRARLFVAPGIALVLAVLLWSANRSGMFSGNSESQLIPADSTAVASAMPLAVSNYLRFTKERTASDANLSHAYSADGFRHLANALEALPGGTEVFKAAQEIRARADSLQQDRTVATHAYQARQAALVASNILGRIPETARPELAEPMRQLIDAASAIDSETRLLEQAALLQTFFERSAQLIGEVSSL